MISSSKVSRTQAAWQTHSSHVDLISDTVAEEVHQVPSRGDKCRKLLSAVRSKISIEPDAFEVFVTILKEEPTLAILSDRLKAAYGEYAFTL